MYHVLSSIESLRRGEEGEEHASKFLQFFLDIWTFGILNNNTLKTKSKAQDAKRHLDKSLTNKQKHLHVN